MIRLAHLTTLNRQIRSIVSSNWHCCYRFSDHKKINNVSTLNNPKINNQRTGKQSTVNKYIKNSYSSNNQGQKAGDILNTGINEAQQSRTMSQIVKQLKAKNISSITNQQIFTHIRYMNSVDVRSLVWQPEAFRNICQIIQQVFAQQLQKQPKLKPNADDKRMAKPKNKYIQLTVQQTVQIAEIVYRLKASERIKISLQKKYPALLPTFQANFKKHYRAGLIQIQATVASVEQACKYYFNFFSSFSNLDYSLYNQLATDIHNKGSSIKKGEAVKIDPLPLISVLELVSQRFELSFNERKMCDTLLTLLSAVSEKLTDLQQLRLYVCLSKSIISTLSQQTAKFIKDNREFFKHKFIGNILEDKMQYDVFLYFVRRCHNYNAPSFRWPYEKALNYYLSHQAPAAGKYQANMSVLKILLAAGENRQSLYEIQQSNMSVINALLMNVLAQAQQKLHEKQSPVYSLILKLFQYGLVPQSTAISIVPFIIEHGKRVSASQQTKSEYFKFIYELAMIKVVDHRFISEISSWDIHQLNTVKQNSNEQKVNNQQNKQQEQEPKQQQQISNKSKLKYNVPDKIRSIQIACIYAEYVNRAKQIIAKYQDDHSNKNNSNAPQQRQKLIKQINQMRTKLNIINNNVAKLSEPLYFKLFCTGLAKQNNLLYNFQRLYSTIFLPNLIINILSSHADDSAQLLPLLTYCVLSCSQHEIPVICNRLLSHADTSPMSNPQTQVTVEKLNKLIWHFDVQRSSRRVLVNMVTLIGHYSELYSSAQIKEQHIYQLCVLLSYPEVVQYVSFNSGVAFFKILYNMFTYFHNQPHQQNMTSKRSNTAAILNNFLLSLMSREYSNLETHLQYFKFISYVVNTHISHIKNLNLLKKILQLSLEMNLLSRDTCIYVHNTNFKFSKPLHRELFQVTYASYMGIGSLIYGKQHNNANYKNLALKFPMVILRNTHISERDITAVEQQLLESIAKLDLRQLYTCLILFSLPKLPQDRQLVYMTSILSGITKLMFSVQRSLLSSALRSLMAILTHQPYQIHPLNNMPCLNVQQLSSNKHKFYVQLRIFLSKLTNILSSSYEHNEGEIMNQEQGTGNTNKLKSNRCYSLPINIHNDIMEMCYWTGLSPKLYLHTMINNCILNNLDIGKIISLFNRVSKLAVIKNPQFIQQIALKLQAASPLLLGQLNINSYELIMSSQYAQNPSSFLQSMFQKGFIRADSLITAYVIKAYPTISSKIQKFPINENMVMIGQVQKNYELLTKLISNQPQSYHETKYGNNIKMLKSKKNNNIYGIIAISANQSSTNLMHSVKNVIAQVQNVSIDQIYLCNEYQADQFFSNKNQDILKFEEMCKSKQKNTIIE